VNRDLWRKLIVWIIGGMLLVQVLSLAKTISKSEPDLGYSQFIQAVKQGEAQEVRLSANPELLPASFLGTRAFIKNKDGKTEAFHLPPNNDRLIRLLINNVNGNLEIPTKNDGHVWFMELSRLFFPVLSAFVVVFVLLQYTVNERMRLKLRLFSFSFILILIIGIFVATSSSTISVSAKNSMPYARFLQQAQDGKVASVGLSPDRSRAVVDDKDGYRDIVNLPPDDRLDNILNQNVKGKIYTIPDDRFNAIVIKNNAKVKGLKNYST
jgi:ATP-dependent Zn protease